MEPKLNKQILQNVIRIWLVTLADRAYILRRLATIANEARNQSAIRRSVDSKFTTTAESKAISLSEFEEHYAEGPGK